ncbi:uncharacterized protein LOC124498734 [Dermatophagoides farinae]|uniref:uncharacterized protein LOC124498734 n=1 Tax=Dermatophagoides farinae TaxID=6954 RepID=UPI003F601E42
MKSSTISMLSTFFNCLIIQLFLITIVIALQKNQPSPSSTLFEDYDDDNPINSPSSNNNNNNDGHSKIANENFSNEASPNNNDEYIGDSGGDGKLYEDNEQENLAKTKFSDERFARLFPSRGGIRSNGRYDDRRLMPKEIAKPKPTLPSFIKSTPPLIKLHITTPSPLLSSRNLQRQRSSATNVTPIPSRKQQQASTTSRPINNIQAARNRLLGQQQQQQQQSLQKSNRQLSGRLSTTTTTTTTPSPSQRRRYNGSSSINNNLGSRFSRNQNSTIPSLNPRGRNF